MSALLGINLLIVIGGLGHREPVNLRPLPAAYCRLAEITRRLATEDHVTVAIPNGYENLPIFVASRTDDPAIFVKRLGITFDCTVAQEGERAFRLVRRAPEPSKLSIVNLGIEAAPYDKDKTRIQLQELVKLAREGQSSGNRLENFMGDPGRNFGGPPGHRYIWE